MYPTLFHVFGFRVDSYSVIWFIALIAAIMWTIRRLPVYQLDDYESRRVMAVSFIFMYVGAKSFEYIAHWGYYMADLTRFLDINRGGVHEFGAVSGAFLSAMVMCIFPRKVSFSRLCDAAAPPALLAIAIGRWGCFLNGCCLGLPTTSFVGVHFPFDRAGVYRHPVQIYYSVIAFLIVGILLAAEKRILPFQKTAAEFQEAKQLHDTGKISGASHYSVIAPLAVILYCLMRLAVVPFRDRAPFMWMMNHSLTYRGIKFALPLMLLWLAYSLYRLKTAGQFRQNRP
ncbi:MAG: prolipoprotein diacylglyceryl transferase [Synergistaceae bacterium]|nr:prolipoprotein diacylglyceryl transferase [Synergistaceae bacterium]